MLRGCENRKIGVTELFLLSGGWRTLERLSKNFRPESTEGKKVATASKKPEVQTKPDDGYQQMSLFGMGALI